MSVGTINDSDAQNFQLQARHEGIFTEACVYEVMYSLEGQVLHVEHADQQDSCQVAPVTGEGVTMALRGATKKGSLCVCPRQYFLKLHRPRGLF